jgi:hypothetical protein
VQTFYQPLFSNSFPFSNLPPALSLQHSFSLQKFFSLSKVSHTKKTKAQKPKAKAPKQKASSFSESFVPSGKQDGAVVLKEGCDIVTGETCIPPSLNINNLREAAVLLARAVPILAYR